MTLSKSITWENSMYAILALLLCGQILVGWSFLIGQLAFLSGNAFSLIRTLRLKRPSSEIVKDTLFTVITISLIIYGLF